MTAPVVALLLIVTYRSPVLWLVPLAVIGFADRVAAVRGHRIAEATGLTADGSTSGITSVLVFGAGTNYALLLISRYREELRHNDPPPRGAAHGGAHAGPAILASNATVVLALLTLLFAVVPSTRSLGVQAASGLVVAAVFVLLRPAAPAGVVRPAVVLAVHPARRRDPVTDDPVLGIGSPRGGPPARHGRGDRGAGRAVCIGLLATPIGLSQTDQFRVQAESVTGYRHSRRALPQRPDRSRRSHRRHRPSSRDCNGDPATPGVVSATPGRSVATD